MSSLRGRTGRMTEEDLRLWMEAVRNIEPLRKRSAPAPAAKGACAPMTAVGAGEPGSVAEPVPGARPRSGADVSAPPPLARLERRFVQRLRRGTAAPGAVMDLHGLRQEEARLRLVAFLRRCQTEGTKAAIVITGKGAPAIGSAEERGVLRRAVPLWLAMPDLRPLIIGFEQAGAGLGGAGALIVRIRAARRA